MQTYKQWKQGIPSSSVITMPADTLTQDLQKLVDKQIQVIDMLQSEVLVEPANGNGIRANKLHTLKVAIEGLTRLFAVCRRADPEPYILKALDES